MNDEDFEHQLRAITGALHRPDPTPAWKDEILARARREADANASPRLLPPRWLTMAWAAAWLAIAAMNVFTQQDSADYIALNSSPAQKQSASDLTTPQVSLPALVAFHQQLNLNLNLDLP